MARKPAARNTSLTKWDEELARQAEIAAGMEDSVATGQFFKLQGGILTYAGAPVPGNELAAVIIDGVLENVYYQGDFDPDVPQAPVCFAFGRDDKELAPHPNVVAGANGAFEAQSPTCADCDWNRFGSAERGRGKACRNTRRLALLPAGTLDGRKFEAYDDPEHFAKASLGFMKLPVTSVKGYAAFVKQVAGAMRRPPHGIFTRISVVPDASTQFKVVFEPLAPVPNELMGVIMERHEEAAKMIEEPYAPLEEEPEVKKPAARGAKKKPAARGGSRRY